MSTKTTEPTTVTAGDTIAWTKTLADYPANAFALHYVLQPVAGGTPISIDATADGTDYAIAVSAATSAGYAAGDYRWISYVTDLATSLERHTISSGNLTIAPDPLAFTATTDLRSHARKVLAAIEATLEGTATSDQVSMSVDGDTLQKRSVAELLQLRSFYAQEVRREEQAERLSKGLQTSNVIRTRFI